MTKKKFNPSDVYKNRKLQQKTKYLFQTILIATVIVLSIIPIESQVLSTSDEYYIKKIEIQGNENFRDSQVYSLMDTKPKGFLARILFWKKDPVLSLPGLEADIERIRHAYHKEGYIDVEAEYKITPIGKDSQKVVILLDINEGERVKVEDVIYNYVLDSEISQMEDVEVEAVPIPDEHHRFLEEIQRRSELNKESNFRDDALTSDLRMIEDYYDQKGYPYAAINYRLGLDEERNRVLVNIIIQPGDKAYYGDVSFEGLIRTERKLLDRLVDINTGSEYDRKDLESTKNNLQSLGLFRFVSVNMSLDQDSSKIPIEIYIREKDNITMSFGIGYGVEDKIRVYTEITKLRFLGGLRTGTLFLKHSSLEPINADLKITQPIFPTLRSRVILNPFYRQEEEPAYSIERLGGNITLNHKLSTTTGTFFTYTYEDNKLKSGADENIIRQTGDSPNHQYYEKSSISFGLIKDTSTPNFSPTKGNILSNVITYSGFNADYHYLRELFDIRHYQLISSSVVIAARMKIGLIKQLHNNEFTPYEDRFYAGGAFSVRGWQRAKLGPKNNEGTPLGGSSYLEGSVEVRYPLWKQLSLVTFLDYGNVWAREFAHRLDDLHYAGGAGLRFSTPIGPLRLDVATPVFESKKAVQFFISLGQSF